MSMYFRANFIFDHILPKIPLNLAALRNIELASFLRWYVAVELHDPAYAKRFYCTYEILEENMMKVHFSSLMKYSYINVICKDAN